MDSSGQDVHSRRAGVYMQLARHVHRIQRFHIILVNFLEGDLLCGLVLPVIDDFRLQLVTRLFVVAAQAVKHLLVVILTEGGYAGIRLSPAHITLMADWCTQAINKSYLRNQTKSMDNRFQASPPVENGGMFSRERIQQLVQ